MEADESTVPDSRSAAAALPSSHGPTGVKNTMLGMATGDHTVDLDLATPAASDGSLGVIFFPGDVSDPEELAKTPAATEDVGTKETSGEKEKEEKKLDFGPPVSFRKLVSLSTWSELLVFTIGVLGAFVFGFGQPLLCVFFGDMVDSLGMSDPDAMKEQVDETARRFCWTGLGCFAVASLQGGAFTFFSETQVKKMRVLYFDAALNMDVGWFDTHQVSSLPSEMSEDMENIGAGLGLKLGIVVQSLSQWIAGYVCAFYLSWQIALVMTAVLPFMAAGGFVMNSSMQAVMQETQSSYAQAAAVVEEVLFAVRTVVAFGGEKREIMRYSEKVEEARRGGVRTRFKAGLGGSYTWALVFVSYAIAFYYGMRLRYDALADPTNTDIISVGSILSAFFCVLIGSFSLGQVPPNLVALTAARASAARFFHILDRPSSIQRRLQDEREILAQPIETLELKSVRFSYPARPEVSVLNGLSLSISKGQKVAVVGESGSGKSTVMALFERFYDPSEGTVLVNGRDLRTLAVETYRKQIGYVGQEPVLFATSIRANISQGCPTATEEDLQRAARYAQLGFVESLPAGFETYVGSGGSQFSGGQKQRIAIARALIKKPSVLFLDEATSALDSSSERMIQDTIDLIGSQHQLGMTIVSIAHRLSTVRNSDIIFVLKAGNIVEQGTHTSLIAIEGGHYQVQAALQEAAGVAEVEPAGSEASELKAAGAGAPAPATTIQSLNAMSGANGNTASDLPQLLGHTAPKSTDKCLSAAPVAKAEKQCANGEPSSCTQEEQEDAKGDRQKRIAKSYRVPMLRLLGYCRPEWPAFLPGTLGAMGAGAAFPLIAAFVLTEAIASFMKPREEMRDDIEQYCVAFIVAGLGLFFCNALQHGCFGVIGEALTKRLRVHLLTSVLRQEVSYHDDPAHTPGKLTKALQVYAYRISNLCISVGDQSNAMCSIATGLVIATVSCWQMTLVMLASLPVNVGATTMQMKAQAGTAKNDSNELKAAQQVVADSIMSARTVHACSAEKELLELYSSMTMQVHKGICKRHVLSGIIFGLATAVQFFVMGFGFWFMGELIEGGHTDFTSGMKAFMGLTYAGLGAAMAFSMTGDVAKAKVAAHDMFELLDRESKIDAVESTEIQPSLSEEKCKPLAWNQLPLQWRQLGKQIEFRGISFHYPRRAQVQVLRDLSFRIEPGQSVGLVGPSGGGKSTVMALIQRFYDPQEGQVLVGESRLELSKIDVRWWRRQLGYVGQEPILFQGTILDNVSYGLEDGEAASAEWLERCKQMSNLGFIDSEEKGWQTEVGPRGGRLSGGQKQRVAICRALLRDPAMLLLDEATSALDGQSEQVVQAALERARVGRTSLAIAHRLSTVQTCDVILVVAEGGIVERGAHSELMELGGVYHKMQTQNPSAA